MTIELRKPGRVEPAAAHAPERWERARQYVHGRRMVVVHVTRKRAYVAWRIGKQLPGAMFWLAMWSPRGLARGLRMWGLYLASERTAGLLRHHAAEKQTAELVRMEALHVAAQRRARLSLVPAALVLQVGMMWMFPRIFASLWGLGLFVLVARSLPRATTEVLIALGVGIAGGFGWYWLATQVGLLLDAVPNWAWILGGAAAVGMCGYLGRPLTRPIVNTGRYGSKPDALTVPLTAMALCTLGNSLMKTPDQVVPLSDPSRVGQGTQLDIELPRGVSAAWVIKKRVEFASALRRELGCVFLTVGKRHPGHLVVYVSDRPLAESDQPRWPLLDGKPIDVFDALPMVTNKAGDWLTLTFAYASMVVGAVPRMGKTFFLRQALIACSLDPRVKIAALDGKGTGDLGCIEPIAWFYSRGKRDIERVRAFVASLLEELNARTDFINSLSEEECPESKVTSALASKYPDQLGPIVVGMDETQSYFDFGRKKNKEHQQIREELAGGFEELVKLGPALGIIILLATQSVNAVTIPRGISTNVVIRACLKVFDYIANDQVLGSGACAKGIDATQFDFDDKGVMFLAADGIAAEMVRSAAGLDVPACKSMIAKALALRNGGSEWEEIVDAEFAPVLDIVADCLRVLEDHGADAAHLVDVAAWLVAMREDYAAMDQNELGKRLRNEGVTVARQLKVGGVNTSGVRVADLRKRGRRASSEKVGKTA